MANISKSVKLGVFTLAIMNVTAVVSLRGLPAEAEYGLSSAFYYLFAANVFLIPTSLVAAELAAMFQDKQGGVFRWVGEAYGKKFGFLAIFFVLEHKVNPMVTDYWSALWWAFMDVTTVGSNIYAVTPTGKILSVVLAALGMMMFPIFTVYVTSLVQQANKRKEEYYQSQQSEPADTK